MTVTIGRRELLAALGGAAAAWPLAARAQQRERMRRIGVLVSSLAADDPERQARGNAFVQGLQERGWADGRNVRIEYRWGLGDQDRQRKYAAELVALAPDVILAAGPPRWRRYNNQTVRCLLCSRMLPTRLATPSSRAWRGRAATPPAS